MNSQANILPEPKWNEIVLEAARKYPCYQNETDERILQMMKDMIGYDYEAYSQGEDGSKETIVNDVHYAYLVQSEDICHEDEDEGPYGGAFASERDYWNYRDSGLASICDWR
ncbi:hypothetical protein [Paenibacillus sp. GXUN7292]|uniref:hypothetical protein n=1 Tax=Paenibacillus sp. GXUN7292 TaxID=3422499 RepID=UPI003D7E4894